MEASHPLWQSLGATVQPTKGILLVAHDGPATVAQVHTIVATSNISIQQVVTPKAKAACHGILQAILVTHKR